MLHDSKSWIIKSNIFQRIDQIPKFSNKQERVCSLKDRLVVVFIDQMFSILVSDDFGSIKLSIRLFGFEQIWLNFEICAKWENLEH